MSIDNMTELDNIQISKDLMKNTPLMRQVIDNMDYMVRVMDADHKVIYMNKKMRRKFSHIMGHICYDLFNKTEKCEHCVTSEAKETGMPDAKDVLLDGRYYKVMSSPVCLKDGANYSIEILHDITNQKQIEDELLKHYEKLKRDIEFAKHLQVSVLPKDGDYWDMIRLNSGYMPSEDLGGDFFDVVQIDEDKALLYIADVSGHGVRSSLITIFLRQLIRTRTFEKEADLSGLLNLLIKNYKDLGIEDEQFISVLFCTYDKGKKELTFLNAGHNCLPIIIAKSGEIKEVPVKGTPVCTLVKESDHQPVTISIETGDRLLLYTDGITEAFNKSIKEPFGTEGISKVIKANFNLDGETLVDRILEESKAFSGVSPIDDMATLLVEFL